MQPGSYTELFFLDEAAALADGHRPCAECRHADYKRFQSVWSSLYPDQRASADRIDAVLHTERRWRAFAKRTYVAPTDALPDGTYIDINGHGWVVLGESILKWSVEGYAERSARPVGGAVTVLTPPSIVGALAAGYRCTIAASDLV
jgi:hypothetical protein